MKREHPTDGFGCATLCSSPRDQSAIDVLNAMPEHPIAKVRQALCSLQNSEGKVQAEVLATVLVKLGLFYGDGMPEAGVSQFPGEAQASTPRITVALFARV